MNQPKTENTKPNGWEQDFDEIGFGNQMRVPGGKYGAKRVELKSFISQAILSAEERAREEAVSKLMTRCEDEHCWHWNGGYEWCKHCGLERSGIYQDEVNEINKLSLPDQEELSNSKTDE